MLGITRILPRRSIPRAIPSFSCTQKLPRGTFTKRYNSNALKSSANADSSGSLILAGAVGGLTALSGGYAWYHFSGTKKVVQAARSTMEQIESAKETIKTKTPSNSEIVTFLRSNLKPYMVFIPGANTALDQLEELSRSHGDELNNILSSAYKDLQEVLTSGSIDQQTGQKTMEIANRLASQLQALSKEVGQKILDDQPQVKDLFEQFKGFLDDLGPEAQNLLQDTEKQLQRLVTSGGISISAAYQVLDEKAHEAKQLAKKAAEKAWEKGSQELKPYVDKLPDEGDVKRVVNENLESAKKMALSGGLSVSNIPQVFEKVKDIASSVAASQGGKDKAKLKEAVDKLKKYFEDLSKQGQGRMKDLAKFGSGKVEDAKRIAKEPKH